MKRLFALMVCLLVLGAIGCEKLAPVDMQSVQVDMQSIQDQVAADAVKQYEIAKRQGDKMTICVQAGLVSAAYLQAKNENGYNRWKSIEKSDCAAAGL